MKKDIVCWMDVREDTEYTTLHGVKKMYFCSSECRTKFIHEPDRYIKAAAEKEQKMRKAA